MDTHQQHETRARATARRRKNELVRVQDLVKTRPENMHFVGAADAAGQIVAFAIDFRVPSFVSIEAVPTPREVRFRVEFQMDTYPAGPPRVMLQADHELFLPGVRCFAMAPNLWAGVPCLYRSWHSRRHDLSFLVRQLWDVITLEPNVVLNAPNDALNPSAAAYFLQRHRDGSLSLPLLPHLNIGLESSSSSSELSVAPPGFVLTRNEEHAAK